MKKKNKKKNSVMFNLISLLIIIMYIISLSIFSYYIYKINILPDKYLYIIFGILIISLLLLIFTIFKRGNKGFKIFNLILTIIMTIGFSYGTIYLNNTYNFFKDTNTEYETISYSVIVNKDKYYKKINDLNNKNISYIDNIYKGKILEELSKKISYKENIVNDINILINLLSDNKTDSIVLEDTYYDILKEDNKYFYDHTKVIYKFDVRVDSHKEEEKELSITDEPFILYISGIDQYGSVKSVRGRSDVNQIAIVNPNTNKILLVNTPRDYYVQLDGTTGLKDKLTHAGIYGIDKSIKTLENLYDIDINYYLRVNFNTVIKLVDVIGGIDIESDKSFRCFTNKNVYVNKGWNHFDGKAALAYSRERYAYVDGDHHRGRNQQQVINAILNKITKGDVLLKDYNNLLKSLNGSFQTDMDMNTITSFIKYQIDKMPSWTIETVNVTGFGKMDYTYSMGNGRKLYVMEPDYNSVNLVKDRIKEVLNEK